MPTSSSRSHSKIQNIVLTRPLHIHLNKHSQVPSVTFSPVQLRLRFRSCDVSAPPGLVLESSSPESSRRCMPNPPQGKRCVVTRRSQKKKRRSHPDHVFRKVSLVQFCHRKRWTPRRLLQFIHAVPGRKFLEPPKRHTHTHTHTCGLGHVTL